MNKSIITLVMLVFLSSLVACGGSGSVSSGSEATVIEDDEEGNAYSGEDLEGGNVSELAFDNNNVAAIDLGDVTESSQYVLAVYSYNSDGDTVAYQLDDNANLSGDLVNRPFQALTTQESVTEDFHQVLREREAGLDKAAYLKETKPQMAALVRQATLGSTRTFKVLSSFSGGGSTESVTATLRYETDNFKAYVDSRNDDSLSDDELEDLLEPFNDLIDTEREFFGEESDVDGDGKFNILFTQTVNELGGSAGGIITGFFYAVDLFDADTYSQSNETEIFYTFVPDPDGDYGVAISKEFSLSNILPSVLPHEYQHMINFNMHYFENDGLAEQSFLNEGLSHLAEDIYSLNGSDYMEETGVENPARIEGYLASIDSLCITCGSSLYQRGGSYLLLRYLYEQAEKGNLEAVANGKTLLNRLVNTSYTGVENIVYAAYGVTDSVESTFADVMGQFGLAVFLSNTGLTSDDRLTFSGINLRATQDDNRGTVLQGPSIATVTSFPSTETLGGASISYVLVSGSQILDQGGLLSLQLGSGSTGGAYIIQTGL